MDVLAHVVSVADGGSARVELPVEIAQQLSLVAGDRLHASMRQADGALELVLTPVRDGARTVVEDRYRGTYSGAPYIAWPLPRSAVPSAPGDDDSVAADFWLGEDHVCGKGNSPEEALADLELRLAELPNEGRIGVARGAFEVPDSIDESNDEVRESFERTPRSKD